MATQAVSIIFGTLIIIIVATISLANSTETSSHHPICIYELAPNSSEIEDDPKLPVRIRSPINCARFRRGRFIGRRINGETDLQTPQEWKMSGWNTFCSQTNRVHITIYASVNSKLTIKCHASYSLGMNFSPTYSSIQKQRVVGTETTEEVNSSTESSTQYLFEVNLPQNSGPGTGLSDYQGKFTFFDSLHTYPNANNMTFSFELLPPK